LRGPFFRQSIEPLALRALSDEEIIATFGPSEEGTIQTLIPDHYEQGIVNYLQFYESLHDICPDPFPGIAALLNQIKAKGIRIAMVTGKGQHNTASRKAGIRVVAAAWAETAEPKKLKAQNPDHLFYSIDEFAAWLSPLI
jgi:phosphoglycolate phosphatase-like HAD superfamily hydrolase